MVHKRVSVLFIQKFNCFFHFSVFNFWRIFLNFQTSTFFVVKLNESNLILLLYTIFVWQHSLCVNTLTLVKDFPIVFKDGK